MKISEIPQAIRTIGLALHSCHNTVTTDDITAQPNETSWRIDHTKEIALLDELEQFLANNTDICPLCGHCNTTP